jgi:hypothetical protein
MIWADRIGLGITLLFCLIVLFVIDMPIGDGTFGNTHAIVAFPWMSALAKTVLPLWVTLRIIDVIGNGRVRLMADSRRSDSLKSQRG